MSPEQLQAAAAVLTMLAAFAALIVAWKAPKAAAKFAEELRSAAAAGEDMRRFRLAVFQSLMRGRRHLLEPDARAAVNLVDIAFSDAAEVRDAHRLFIAATLQPLPVEAIVERYHALCAAVGRAMGFGEWISGTDVRLGWYPDAVAKLDEAALAEAEEKLARRAAQHIAPPVFNNPTVTPPEASRYGDIIAKALLKPSE